jgi:predicted ester cyclase
MYDGDYVAHTSHHPEVIQEIEAFKQFVSLFQVLHPDLHFTVEDQIAEGDQVVTRWAVRSPGLGADIAVTGISIHRLADGRFVESWHNWDAVGALQARGPELFDKFGLNEGKITPRIDKSTLSALLEAGAFHPQLDHPDVERLRKFGIFKEGIVMHGGFFLGRHKFYESLRDMNAVERKKFCMTSVMFVNQLYGNLSLAAL